MAFIYQVSRKLIKQGDINMIKRLRHWRVLGYYNNIAWLNIKLEFPVIFKQINFRNKY